MEKSPNGARRGIDCPQPRGSNHTSSSEDLVNEALADFRAYDETVKLKGSRATGLAFDNSDVDLTTNKELDEIKNFFTNKDDKFQIILDMTNSRTLPRLVLEHANGIAIDLVHNRTDKLSHVKDEFMRCCIGFDPRVKEYLMKVKQFRKSFEAEMPVQYHYPNSYLLSCIAIFVLQNVDRPVLPRLKCIDDVSGFIEFDLDQYARETGRLFKHVYVLMESARTVFPQKSCLKDQYLLPARNKLNEFVTNTQSVDQLFAEFLSFLCFFLEPSLKVDLFLYHKTTEIVWATPDQVFEVVEPIDQKVYEYDYERAAMIGMCAFMYSSRVQEVNHPIEYEMEGESSDSWDGRSQSPSSVNLNPLAREFDPTEGHEEKPKKRKKRWRRKRKQKRKRDGDQGEGVSEMEGRKRTKGIRREWR